VPYEREDRANISQETGTMHIIIPALPGIIVLFLLKMPAAEEQLIATTIA
jgi:hypothetical protein